MDPITQAEVDQITHASPMVATGLALTFILFAFKLIPGFPMHFVPLIALVLGAVIYPVFNGFTGANVIYGLLIGGFSVGLHQSGKQLFKGKDNGGTIVSLIILILPLFFLVGCATTGSQPVNQVESEKQRAATTAIIVRTSAHYGAFYLLQKDPKSRGYFDASVQLINIVVNEGQYDPIALRDRLQNVPVEELKSAEGFMALTAALDLYQLYFSKNVNSAVNQNLYVRPVLVGLRDGILLALQSEPPERSASAFAPPYSGRVHSPRGAANLR